MENELKITQLVTVPFTAVSIAEMSGVMNRTAQIKPSKRALV